MTTAKDRLNNLVAPFGIANTSRVQEYQEKLLADILELSIMQDEPDELMKAIANGGGVITDEDYYAHKRNQLRAELRTKLTAYFTNKRGD